MLGKCVHFVSGIELKQLIKVDHHNGYDFYIRLSEYKKGNDYAMVYFLYDNHFFPIQSNKERIKLFLDQNPNFSLQQWLTESFEESLKTGARVLKGLAQYLHREQEALEAVERFKQQKEKENAKREAEKAEKERQRKIEYESKLTVAEKEFMNNQKINANLFLALCDKYYITVPIRTRGWIIESLTNISCNKDNRVQYSYSGNNSTKIADVARQLLNTLNENNDPNAITLDELNHLFGKAE